MTAPLVFLHGMFGAAEDWHPVLDAFPGSRALDLPGHGAAVADGCETFSAAVDRVRAETPPGAVLVGYSLGGRIALAAAARDPAHLRGLVLESTTAGLDDDNERARRLAVDDARAARLASDPAAFLREFWQQPLFETLAAHPRRDVLLVERIARAARAPRGLAEVVRALSVARQPNLWPELSRLTVPTQIIAGARDARYAGIAERMRASIPGARSTVVKDVGHNVHLESPARFIEALREFLSSLQERAA